MIRLSLRDQKIIDTLQKCSNIGENAPQHFQFLRREKQRIESKESKIIVQISNALGNIHRFTILNLLYKKDRCVCELEAALNISQASVSRHLRILEHANLIHSRKDGKFTHYYVIKTEFEKFNQFWQNWTSELSNIL